jgi:hypothetical protein
MVIDNDCSAADLHIAQLLQIVRVSGQQHRRLGETAISMIEISCAALLPSQNIATSIAQRFTSSKSKMILLILFLP